MTKYIKLVILLVLGVSRVVKSQLDFGADEATINKEVDRSSGPFKVTKELFDQVISEAHTGLFLM